MRVLGRSGRNTTRTGRLLTKQRRAEAKEHNYYERRPPQEQRRALAHAKKRVREIFRQMADDAIKRGLTDELLALAYIRAGRKLH
jgi:hypothetical protein